MSNKKSGFSLVELSIVVVIISVLVTIILSTQVIITRAKINSIYNDVAGMRNAFLTFRVQQLCLPGECSAAYLQAQGFSSSYYAAANGTAGCAAGTSIYSFDGQIDTPTKRSCAFSQLQMQNYINGVTNSPVSTSASLAGSNLPFARFSLRAAWDLRASNTTGLYPIELSVNLGASPPSTTSAAFIYSWIGTHALILRNAVYTSSSTLANDDIVSPPSGTVNGMLSPYMAGILDSKFDDGSPLTGIIISGVNNGATPSISSGLVPTRGCYGLSSGGTFQTITGLEVYGSYKNIDLNDSCIVAFQIAAP